MAPSIVATIVYFIGFIAAFAGLTIVSKTNKKQNLISWLVVGMMTMCGFQAFVASLFTFIRVPVNILSLGIANLFLGCGLIFFIYKTKKIQMYYIEKTSVLALVIMCYMIVFFIMKTCTLELAPHYLAVDAAAHFNMATNVIKSQSVGSMFFSALHHSIFIELFSPFISKAVFYKLFVLSDMLHLLFEWMMFYCLIERYAKDTFFKLFVIVVTVIYAWGYPANSTLFGFTYLGMGIAVVAYLLIVFDWFMDEEFSKIFSVSFLSLGCLGIFESYVLFMPITFFAILFGMFYKQYKCKKLISMETIKYGLWIFLYPTIAGLYYTYGGIFGTSQQTTVSGAIALEGGIYRDLYSNFLVLVPFVLFAFVKIIEKKENKLELWLMPLLLIFMFGLFCLGLEGKVSAYYFYKNYYLLWLLAFDMFFIAIATLQKDGKLLLCFGTMTWGVIFFAMLHNVETSIAIKAPLYVPYRKASSICDIYSFNRDAINIPHYSSDKLDLYRYAVEKIGTEDNVVAIAGSWEDWFWMEEITDQSLDPGYYHWSRGEEVFIETMKVDADYVVVLYDSPVYVNNVEIMDSYEAIYSNPIGKIIKIQGN